MPLGELHTHIWAYMPLGTPTPPGSPIKYSMDTYSILWQANFQWTKVCNIYPWLRELLISLIWHFLRLSPKLVQNVLETFQKCFIHDSVVIIKIYHSTCHISCGIHTNNAIYNMLRNAIFIVIY